MDWGRPSFCWTCGRDFRREACRWGTENKKAALPRPGKRRPCSGGARGGRWAVAVGTSRIIQQSPTGHCDGGVGCETGGAHPGLRPRDSTRTRAHALGLAPPTEWLRWRGVAGFGFAGSATRSFLAGRPQGRTLVIGTGGRRLHAFWAPTTIVARGSPTEGARTFFLHLVLLGASK